MLDSLDMGTGKYWLSDSARRQAERLLSGGLVVVDCSSLPMDATGSLLRDRPKSETLACVCVASRSTLEHLMSLCTTSRLCK